MNTNTVWVCLNGSWSPGEIVRQLGDNEYRVTAAGETLDVTKEKVFERNEDEDTRRSGVLHELRSACSAEIAAALIWRRKQNLSTPSFIGSRIAVSYGAGSAADSPAITSLASSVLEQLRKSSVDLIVPDNDPQSTNLGLLLRSILSASKLADQSNHVTNIVRGFGGGTASCWRYSYDTASSSFTSASITFRQIRRASLDAIDVSLVTKSLEALLLPSSARDSVTSLLSAVISLRKGSVPAAAALVGLEADTLSNAVQGDGNLDKLCQSFVTLSVHACSEALSQSFSLVSSPARLLSVMVGVAPQPSAANPATNAPAHVLNDLLHSRLRLGHPACPASANDTQFLLLSASTSGGLLESLGAENGKGPLALRKVLFSCKRQLPDSVLEGFKLKTTSFFVEHVIGGIEYDISQASELGKCEPLAVLLPSMASSGRIDVSVATSIATAHVSYLLSSMSVLVPSPLSGTQSFGLLALSNGFVSSDESAEMKSLIEQLDLWRIPAFCSFEISLLGPAQPKPKKSSTVVVQPPSPIQPSQPVPDPTLSSGPPASLEVSPRRPSVSPTPSVSPRPVISATMSLSEQLQLQAARLQRVKTPPPPSARSGEGPLSSRSSEQRLGLGEVGLSPVSSVKEIETAVKPVAQRADAPPPVPSAMREIVSVSHSSPLTVDNTTLVMGDTMNISSPTVSAISSVSPDSSVDLSRRNSSVSLPLADVSLSNGTEMPASPTASYEVKPSPPTTERTSIYNPPFPSSQQRTNRTPSPTSPSPPQEHTSIPFSARPPSPVTGVASRRPPSPTASPLHHQPTVQQVVPPMPALTRVSASPLQQSRPTASTVSKPPPLVQATASPLRSSVSRMNGSSPHHQSPASSTTIRKPPPLASVTAPPKMPHFMRTAAATAIQRVWRGCLVRRRALELARLSYAAFVIQEHYLRRFLRRRLAAIKIQRWFRHCRTYFSLLWMANMVRHFPYQVRIRGGRSRYRSRSPSPLPRVALLPPVRHPPSPLPSVYTMRPQLTKQAKQMRRREPIGDRMMEVARFWKARQEENRERYAQKEMEEVRSPQITKKARDLQKLPSQYERFLMRKKEKESDELRRQQSPPVELPKDLTPRTRSRPEERKTWVKQRDSKIEQLAARIRREEAEQSPHMPRLSIPPRAIASRVARRDSSPVHTRLIAAGRIYEQRAAAARKGQIREAVQRASSPSRSPQSMVDHSRARMRLYAPIHDSQRESYSQTAPSPLHRAQSPVSGRSMSPSRSSFSPTLNPASLRLVRAREASNVITWMQSPGLESTEVHADASPVERRRAREKHAFEDQARRYL